MVKLGLALISPSLFFLFGYSNSEVENTSGETEYKKFVIGFEVLCLPPIILETFPLILFTDKKRNRNILKIPTERFKKSNPLSE